MGALLSLLAMLCGCPGAHDGTIEDVGVPLDSWVAGDAPDGQALDGSASCVTPRSVTLIVIVNTDGANDYRAERAALVVELVEALLTGDADSNGTADFTPLDAVRVMVTPNESCVVDYEIYDGRWLGSRGSCGLPDAEPVFVALPGGDWQEELRCRLTPGRGTDWPSCVDEPLETALIALADEADGIDVSPAVPLGGTLNSAWQDRNDLVVLLLEAADWRDDCSRRLEFPAAVCAGTPDQGGSCCPANLPPVSRTSEGLRRIFGDRPYVVASLGMHPAFDALTDDPALLDGWLASAPPPECAVMRPHVRMIELARELHPYMDLIPLECDGLPWSRPADVGPFARHVFSRFCSP